MAKLTIDGIPVEVPDGTVLLEACKAMGIDVPNFCYYPKLELIGACRMCLVEIVAGPLPPAALAKPQASCTTTVRGDGWEVLTNSPKVEKLRKGMLEFLLINHSLTCPTCDMGGECELQDNTWRYGPGISRMQDPKAYRKITSFGPFVDLNMQRCVQCQRCTRYCDEVMGNRALGMEHRGAATQITGFPGEDLDCVLCGNCIEVCPVGALTSDMFDTKARAWDRVETPTICTYCADGCSMKLDTKAPAGPNNTPIYHDLVDRYAIKLYKDRGEVLRARAYVDSGILIEEHKGNNQEFLCHKGRFAYHVINHAERLTQPLVRRNGELVPATWPEAMAAAAAGFGAILQNEGPDALGGIGSEKTTNEESYLFGKFIRTVFGTNNIDCRVSQKDLRTERAPGMMPTMEDLFQSNSILVIGAGITEENPLTESRIRLAVRHNRASLVVAGSRRSLIADETTSFLRCKPGAEAALAYALGIALAPARQDALQAAVKKAEVALLPAALERGTQGGRVPMEVVQKKAEDDLKRAQDSLANFRLDEALQPVFSRMTVEDAAQQAGVTAEMVEAAARAVAGAPQTHIVLGQDLLVKSPGGREAAEFLKTLCRSFGWADPAELLEHNNSRGSRDVGVLPDLLPGYQPVGDAGRDAFAEVWGTQVPGKAGMNTVEMFQAATTGKLKGLYIVGSNPFVTYPGGDLIRRAFENLSFLVVQEAFLTHTAALADVVFPAAVWAEKDGTFTNWEGRVQRVRPAVAPPGEARTDDEIIADLAHAMGHEWRTRSFEQTLNEIAQVSGIYQGITEESLNTPTGTGVLWPRLNTADRSTGALESPDLSELSDDAAYPHILFVGNDTYHHGTLTSWDEGPRTAEPVAYVEVSPEDAHPLRVGEGDHVRLESARGTLELPCRVTDDIAPGSVFVPITFPETPVNLLLDAGRHLDRVRLSKGTPRIEREAELVSVSGAQEILEGED